MKWIASVWRHGNTFTVETKQVAMTENGFTHIEDAFRALTVMLELAGIPEDVEIPIIPPLRAQTRM